MVGDYIIKLIKDNPSKLRKLYTEQDGNYLVIFYSICGVKFGIKI